MRPEQERALAFWWLLVIACLTILMGCASTPKGKGWYTPPVELRAAQEPPPPCAFEDPYLPEPCTIEVAKGEKLVVRNARPEKPTKKHSWLWWLLLSLVTF